MKIIELFEAEGNYYPPSEGSEGPIQDFIITQYELGKISFEEATQKIKETSDSSGKFSEVGFWMMELNSARINVEDMKTAH